jgi:hypothetical protein
LLSNGLNAIRLNRRTEEIQPRQHLTRFVPDVCLPKPAPESVDAAKPGLYKTANGGGRNPAADVL